MCKRCFARDEKVKHQRKLQLDLLFDYDSELYKKFIKDNEKLFSVNVPRLMSKIIGKNA